MADSGQIEQVLMNLATNARDAMPKGGVLTIATARIDMKTEITGLYGVLEPGPYAVIAVSDTGAGMDEDERQKIFEPFFTSKETGKGTGLGLSIVYGIIKQHNGEINVYSASGKGTTFKIYLKLIPSEEEKTAASAVPEIVGGSETILIAEDDQDVRQYMVSILEEFGYTVIEAVDGDDAVRQFGRHGNRVDLLLFDVVMPNKNGKEAYDAISATNRNVPVLFTSGYTADIIHNKGVIDRNLNFISKPVSPQELLAKIRETLSR
jgi:CheY-like chemotaxis protein